MYYTTILNIIDTILPCWMLYKFLSRKRWETWQLLHEFSNLYQHWPVRFQEENASATPKPKQRNNSNSINSCQGTSPQVCCQWPHAGRSASQNSIVVCCSSFSNNIGGGGGGGGGGAGPQRHGCCWKCCSKWLEINPNSVILSPCSSSKKNISIKTQHRKRWDPIDY